MIILFMSTLKGLFDMFVFFQEQGLVRVVLSKKEEFRMHSHKICVRSSMEQPLMPNYYTINCISLINHMIFKNLRVSSWQPFVGPVSTRKEARISAEAFPFTSISLKSVTMLILFPFNSVFHKLMKICHRKQQRLIQA